MLKSFVHILFSFAFSMLLNKGNAQGYNYFFGNIHSHSSYSDGNKDSSTSFITTPLQDFNYAKTSLDVDFYGICEHNHLSAGLSNPADWHLGLANANAATINNDFVALYGMEWGVISGGGHVIVYGYDSLMGWDSGDYDVYVAQNDYANLWKKINNKTGAFAYLAHPQTTDYTNLFTTAYSASADSAIVGMAARSGPAFSTDTTYTNPSASNYIARYNEALSLGYHLGVGLDHDTHNSVFGKQTAGRLVILSTTLTKATVLDAIRKMRFYSSDDWNVKVDFNISAQPMGSIYSHAGNPTISISINDPDIEATASIQVYYGIPGSGSLPTLLTSNTNLNTLTYTHSIANLSKYYYYVKITQTDGDVIWTSPIWYTRNDAIITNVPSGAFNVPASKCIGSSITFTDVSTNAPTSWAWYFTGANITSSTVQNPSVTYTAAGSYTAILIASNSTGSSAPITQTITVSSLPIVAATSATICSGKTATLTASGANTYSWNAGPTGATFTAVPTINTIYTVTGTSSAGCSKTATASILVNALPGVTITVSSTTICTLGTGGTTIALTGVPAGGVFSGVGVTGSVFNSQLTAGNHIANYTYTNSITGCSKTASKTLSVVVCTGIETNMMSNELITIYPNPNNGEFVIRSAESMNLDLVNELGQTIQNIKLNAANNYNANVSNLSSGIYFIIGQTSKFLIKQKIVVSK